jgi:hypothetical protein
MMQVQRTCDARRVIVSDAGPSPPIDARRTVSPNAFTSLSCIDEYMNGASAEPVAVAQGTRLWARGSFLVRGKPHADGNSERGRVMHDSIHL